MQKLLASPCRSLALLTLVIALASPREAAAVATRTYEIVFRAYCHPGTISTCDNENVWRMRMRGVNEIWRPNKVSFRIAEFQVVYDDTYAVITEENADTLAFGLAAAGVSARRLRVGGGFDF